MLILFILSDHPKLAFGFFFFLNVSPHCHFYSITIWPKNQTNKQKITFRQCDPQKKFQKDCHFGWSDHYSWKNQPPKPAKKFAILQETHNDNAIWKIHPRKPVLLTHQSTHKKSLKGSCQKRQDTKSSYLVWSHRFRVMLAISKTHLCKKL